MNDNAGLKPVPLAAHDGLYALSDEAAVASFGLSAVPALPRISEVGSSAIVTIVCQIVLVESPGASAAG